MNILKKDFFESYGDYGENEAVRAVLAYDKNALIIRNPMVPVIVRPAPKFPPVFRDKIRAYCQLKEQDAIIILKGRVFVMQIKNWKGALRLAPEGSFILENRYVARRKNPVSEINDFCVFMKKHLSGFGADLADIKTEPVAVFIKKDCEIEERISGSYPNLVYETDLPAYFNRYGAVPFDDKLLGLREYLYSWDIIAPRGTGGEFLVRINQDRVIHVRTTDQKRINIPLKDIKTLKRNGNDTFYLKTKDGASTEIYGGSEKIFFRKRGKGEQERYILLADIEKIENNFPTLYLVIPKYGKEFLAKKILNKDINLLLNTDLTKISHKIFNRTLDFIDLYHEDGRIRSLPLKSVLMIKRAGFFKENKENQTDGRQKRGRPF